MLLLIKMLGNPKSLKELSHSVLASKPTKQRLIASALSTREAMKRATLTGHDPYDGLVSPLFRLPVLRSNHLVRFGSQQVILRFPIDLRPLLRTPVQLNPVTIGLYIQGLANLSAAGLIDSEAARDEAAGWIEMLKERVSPGWSGPAWGYPFPWEGRRHRFPANLPTVVATSMVVNGLYRGWKHLGLESARALVVESAQFVLNDLPRSAGNEDSFCWAYSPLDRQVILNATLKGTRVLMQALDAGLESDGDALAQASASARFVVENQDPSGSWPYACAPDPRSWSDSYHTGYVLECLRAYTSLSGDSEFDDAIARGWRYYRDTFFDEQGRPLYFSDRAGAIDATVAGQALITLTLFDDRELAERVAARTISTLSLGDGTFAFRYQRGYLRKAHFIRWATAWMFAGLSTLVAGLDQ